jgi:general secretion pathway protein G
MRRPARHLRAGFSLLELVIVVMILGIIATIAAPKLLGTSQEATDNGLRHTLSVIRGAIDTYSAEHEGDLPAGDETTFKNQLMPYLRGKEFPVCSVGPAANNAIRMMAGTDPVGGSIGGTEATQSWVYKFETGDFHVNCDDLSSDGVTTYDKF